jgi:hypothetical protein
LTALYLCAILYTGGEDEEEDLGADISLDYRYFCRVFLYVCQGAGCFARA